MSLMREMDKCSSFQRKNTYELFTTVITKEGANQTIRPKSPLIYSLTIHINKAVHSARSIEHEYFKLHYIRLIDKVQYY